VDLVGGGAVGALVGLLVGLSVSEVVGTVVGGLVALLAGFFGLRGETGGDQAATGALTGGGASPWRVTGFSVAAIITLLVALVVRTHNLLGQPPAEVAARWAEAGFDPATARDLAAVQILGIVPSTWERVATGEGEAGDRAVARAAQGVLFAGDKAGNCADLEQGNAANPAERLHQFRLAGGSWAVVAAALAPLEPSAQAVATEAAWKVICDE